MHLLQKQKPQSTHRTYLRNERAIRKAIMSILGQRKITVRVYEVCRLAHISPPTFYNHHHNATDALHSLEKSLQADFFAQIPKATTNRDLIFTVLLNFIHRNRAYFVPALTNHNTYLVSTILQRLRPTLANTIKDDKSYSHYCNNLKSLIEIWVVYEKCSPQRLSFYTTQMLRTRPISFQL